MLAIWFSRSPSCGKSSNTCVIRFFNSGLFLRISKSGSVFSSTISGLICVSFLEEDSFSFFPRIDSFLALDMNELAA